MTSSSTDTTVRLAKRLAESLPCSRREAELYIEGGWVSVDGQLVEEAGARVAPEQAVELAPGATLKEIPPVTILLHKPAGFNAGIGRDGAPALTCLGQEALTETDRSGQRFLKRHLGGLTLTNPLDTKASGLVIFTQDFRVARKLVDESARIEQEYIVEVAGDIVQNGLALLNHGLPFNGKPLAPIKVSWQNETRLRFALKGVQPGQIEHMCRIVGLSVVAMKRLRVGRISMAALPSGQWRYLQGFERF
ncbi:MULTISPECIES: rRNA pseudouridine synthase [unclassified Janthinobacterium]|uniref:rRNA pseudouridine synthase n=1 Tax=unclassified Janthinobacterium TaxID=2610881 RepID=UPI0003729C62|nr:MULTISPECIES: rRNA pseudouridine synthase [unclassified Janthinobacterium]MEC5159359.1 23S rRNA pseudouridine2604 synthase [Janthinobacterium sp. CG_S6]